MLMDEPYVNPENIKWSSSWGPPKIRPQSDADLVATVSDMFRPNE